MTDRMVGTTNQDTKVETDQDTKVEIVFVDTVGHHQNNGAFKRRVLLRVDGEERDVVTLSLDSSQARDRLSGKWAKLAECDLEIMDAKLRGAALVAVRDDQEAAAAQKAHDTGGGQPDPLANTPDDVKRDAEALLNDSNLIEQITRDLQSVGIVGEKRTALLVYLVGTSRKLDRPLAAIVQSTSASGKSYLLRQVASMMPPEDVLAAHSITEQVLYYLPEGSLRHKFIISGERTQTDDNGQAEAASKAFRELVADGELRKLVTIKDENGNPSSRYIVQEGPVAFAESSTATALFEEDSTRLLSLSMDESARQTADIQSHLARVAAGSATSSAKRDRILEIHQTAQRMLSGELGVIIPFAGQLRLPATKVSVRRSFSHLLSVIQVVAFLCQKQRQVQVRGDQRFIVATPADYETAVDVLLPVLVQGFSSLPAKSQELLKVVDGRREDENFATFTRDDLSDWLGISYREAARRLRPLIGTGLISQDTSSKPYKLRRTDAAPPNPADLGLPNPAELEDVCSHSLLNPAVCSQTLADTGVNYAAGVLPNGAESPDDVPLGGKRQDACRIDNPSNDKELGANGKIRGKVTTTHATEAVGGPDSPPPDADQPPPQADADLPHVDQSPRLDVDQDQRPDSDDADLEPEDEPAPPAVDPTLPPAEQAKRYRTLAKAAEALFPELGQQYNTKADEIEQGAPK